MTHRTVTYTSSASRCDSNHPCAATLAAPCLICGRQIAAIHDLPAKEVGDFILAVVPTDPLNGPYAVRLFGGPERDGRLLACRFATVEAASEYITSESKKSIRGRRLW